MGNSELITSCFEIQQMNETMIKEVGNKQQANT